MARTLDRTLIVTLVTVLLAAAAPGADAAPLVKRSGWLHVVWGDPAPGSGQPAAYRVLLTEDTGEVAELAIDEVLARGVLLWNGRQVEVTVEAGQEAGPLTVRAARLLAPPEGVPQIAGGVSGSQPWVSILCKFSDIAAEPQDLSYFQGMYANVPGGLDHYWRELSYGEINVAGSTAVTWVTLPNPQTFYAPTPGSGFDADLTALFSDCTAAADPLVDFSNGGTPFVGINMMFNDVLDCCAWGGTRFATLDGVSKVWRVTWEPPWGYADEGVIGHEMGHGFGLPHSTNWDNDGFPYDSPWDVMSSATGYAVVDPTYGRLGKHTLTYHKDILGWIPADERFEASTDNIHVIVLDHLALASTENYRMARVPIAGSSRFYTVEARDLVGSYDGALPGNVVIISEVDPGREEPAWVVDSDVPPANFGDNEGSMWRVGETFVDAANDIAIEILAATADGFQVAITTGNPDLIFADGFESGDTSAW